MGCAELSEKGVTGALAAAHNAFDTFELPYAQFDYDNFEGVVPQCPLPSNERKVQPISGKVSFQRWLFPRGTTSLLLLQTIDHQMQRVVVCESRLCAHEAVRVLTMRCGSGLRVQVGVDGFVPQHYADQMALTKQNGEVMKYKFSHGAGNIVAHD